MQTKSYATGRVLFAFFVGGTIIKDSAAMDSRLTARNMKGSMG